MSFFKKWTCKPKIKNKSAIRWRRESQHFFPFLLTRFCVENFIVKNTLKIDWNLVIQVTAPICRLTQKYQQKNLSAQMLRSAQLTQWFWYGSVWHFLVNRGESRIALYNSIVWMSKFEVRSECAQYWAVRTSKCFIDFVMVMLHSIWLWYRIVQVSTEQHVLIDFC